MDQSVDSALFFFPFFLVLNCTLNSLDFFVFCISLSLYFPLALSLRMSFLFYGSLSEGYIPALCGLMPTRTSKIIIINLSSAVQHLADWLRNRGLILNETKTQIMSISPVRSQTFDLQVQCNGLPLPTVRSAKYLGLHYDADMSWNTMVDHVAWGVASKVGVLRRYATFLPFQCRIAYFRSFILSHFMYADSA